MRALIARDALELASKVVGEGCRRGISLGTAESCTGGLVAAALTSVPGASETFMGSVVSYDPAVKIAVLGVDPSTVEVDGVVSSRCAKEMAQGARRALSVDIAVSVTGIAGPGGAEPGKPVGTVWFGIASPWRTRTLCRHLKGGREAVRKGAVKVALGLLHEEMLELSSRRLGRD